MGQGRGTVGIVSAGRRPTSRTRCLHGEEGLAKARGLAGWVVAGFFRQRGVAGLVASVLPAGRRNAPSQGAPASCRTRAELEEDAALRGRSNRSASEWSVNPGRSDRSYRLRDVAVPVGLLVKFTRLLAGVVASAEGECSEGVSDVGQRLAVAGVVELVGQQYRPSALPG
jgi:hypothetical protein